MKILFYVVLIYLQTSEAELSSCFDEFSTCDLHATKLGCSSEPHGLQYSAAMLSFCTEACRKVHGNEPSLLKDILSTGGAEEVLTGVMGDRIPWCSLQEGYNSRTRYSFIKTNVMGLAVRKFIPPITTGFLKSKMSSNLHQILLSFRDSKLVANESYPEKRSCIRGEYNYYDNKFTEECSRTHTEQVQVMFIGQKERKAIFKELHPKAEEWSGIKLKQTAIYGIRRYFRGATCFTHTDRGNTHIISAILNVDQQVNEPWPLQIVDHEGIPHSFLLSPGEMLWYEGARLLHGRVLPLNGEYFDNIFVHFKPAARWYYENWKDVPAEVIRYEDL